MRIPTAPIVPLLMLLPSTIGAAEEPEAKTGPELSVEQLAEQTIPSVVVIKQSGRDGRDAGLGSGFVVGTEGLIVTNLHVIGEARDFEVQTDDGTRLPVVSVHAVDRDNDLAVIRVKPADEKLPPGLPLAPSNSVTVGQAVVAVGNPYGLTHSIVSGVVSGLRDIDERAMIQIALPIEPGNSGGPLLDRTGRVVGVLTLKSRVTRNLGFAVPVARVRSLVETPGRSIPIESWRTIGRLDPQRWETVFGGTWRQRAGTISVTGRGNGFGGRVLCLSKTELPPAPIEVGVWVKLGNETGAAGLVFHADGDEKHYGFYPSGNELRLTRFDGADVFSWQVLEQKPIPAKFGDATEWLHLKVRIEKNRFLCSANDEVIFTSRDRQYLTGRAGLVAFRATPADFRGFKIAERIEPVTPSEKTRMNTMAQLVGVPVSELPTAAVAEELINAGPRTTDVLRQEAREMERRAAAYRELAAIVHREQVQTELKAWATTPEAEQSLFDGAMLIAALGNEELDRTSYRERFEAMVAELRDSLPKPTGDQPLSEAERIAALDRMFFEVWSFHGSRLDYENPANSSLGEVIDDREGLPITLSLLYIEFGRRLGLNLLPIGLPGHFVVRHEPKTGQSELIDVFDGGKRLSRNDAVRLVETNTRLEFEENHLREVSPIEVVVRMVQNLFTFARRGEDLSAMLLYIDTLVLLEEDSIPHRWSRAVLRYRTERYTDARADLDWVRSQPDGGLDPRALDQLDRALDAVLNPAE